jgi:hypothetical protein|tara:strand:- start:107 stop:370 length:264 start_codon:yes stop_codon:yes gene_type:complete
MFKEIKYLFFIIIIAAFIFFTSKYYFSDINKKKSYRSLSNIDNKINTYSLSIPSLENDTKNIIVYVKNTQSQNKKNFLFWELIDKND